MSYSAAEKSQPSYPVGNCQLPVVADGDNVCFGDKVSTHPRALHSVHCSIWRALLIPHTVAALFIKPDLLAGPAL